MKKLLSALIICTLISPLIISCDSGGDDPDVPITDDTAGTDDTTDDSSDDTTDDTTDTTSFFRMTLEERGTVDGPLFNRFIYEYTPQGYIDRYTVEDLENDLTFVFEFNYSADGEKLESIARDGSIYAEFEYTGDVITIQNGTFGSTTTRSEYTYDANGFLASEDYYVNGVFDCRNIYEVTNGNTMVWDYSCQGDYFEYTYDAKNNPLADFYPEAFMRALPQSLNNALTRYETTDDELIEYIYIYNSQDYITQSNWSNSIFDYEYTYTYETLEL